MQQTHGFMEVDLTILRRIVTGAVTEHLISARKTDRKLVDRLRRYERTAWDIGLDAHTIQVISSGRRLLGDRECLRPRPSQSRREVGAEPAKRLQRAA